MANYTYVSDLVDDVLFRAGENENAATTSGSDYYNAVLRYLNRAYQAIWTGGGELLPDISEQWWWLKKYGSGVITLLPVFDTGTVNVANNSSSINFSTVPQRSGSNIQVQNYHLKIDNHPDVFRLQIHVTGNTTATLDSSYTGPTDPAASFRCYKLDYTLATDVLELDSPMFAYQSHASGNRIELMAEDYMRDKWPIEQAQVGVPQNFALIGQSSGARRVRFSHYGGTSDTELIRIDYNYLARPADLTDITAEPDMPREWRKLLADWALLFVLQDKEDDKQQDVLTLAAGGLRAMAMDNQRRAKRQSRAFGRLYPRPQSREARKGPLRTSSGLIIG